MPKYEAIYSAVLSASTMEVYQAVLNEYSGVTHLWMPDLEFKPRDGNAMDQVGAVCDTKARSHGITGRFSETVIDVKPGELFEFKFSGQFSGTERWTFERTIEGKTKAQVAWIGTSNKFILSLISPFINVEKELNKSRENFLNKLEKNFATAN